MRHMPTDPETGLPHVILPGNPTSVDGSPVESNYHHHFYNRRDPDLEGRYRLTFEQLRNPELIPFHTIAGLAVRISRGQLLPVPTHKLGHEYFPLGPVLPHTIPDKFTTAVKACSGLASRLALDVTSGTEPQLVYMDDYTFERVASPGVLYTEKAYHGGLAIHRKQILGSFFVRHAAKQDLSHISGAVVDEFLHTSNDEQRLALGKLILAEAVEIGIEPILADYVLLRAKGMVHPARPSLRKVVWNCIAPERRPIVFNVLRDALWGAY